MLKERRGGKGDERRARRGKEGTSLNGLFELAVAYIADDFVAGHHFMAVLFIRGLAFDREYEAGVPFGEAGELEGQFEECSSVLPYQRYSIRVHNYFCSTHRIADYKWRRSGFDGLRDHDDFVLNGEMSIGSIRRELVVETNKAIEMKMCIC